MKKLVSVILFFVIQIALEGQSFFYYSSTPDSSVGQGQTVFVTNGPEYDFSSIGWSYDIPGHTVFDLILGFTNNSTDERYVAQFHIPYPITDISESVFSFSNKDADTLFEETPAMRFMRYKYNSSGPGFEYMIKPPVSSATFTIHSIVFGEGGLDEGGVLSAAVDFVQVYGSSLDGFTRDYGVIRYNSDYPVNELPVAAVPEPSAYALFLGISILGFVGFKRVRAK
ncbi:MAG: PEP-CTERM sorting domain-containing protein [Candidatus Paceibacterota bacterium]|jgi:hypothetical protein